MISLGSQTNSFNIELPLEYTVLWLSATEYARVNESKTFERCQHSLRVNTLFSIAIQPANWDMRILNRQCHNLGVVYVITLI